MAPNSKEEALIATCIVRDAGGEVVGRTRLQKIAFMLNVMGLGDDLGFEYRNYGPYSDRLSHSVKIAEVLDLLTEELKPTPWGGFYSIFRSSAGPSEAVNPDRKSVISLGNGASSVELELAATAVFLAKEERFKDVWAETYARKPEKSAQGRLERARTLLQKFVELDVKHKLPAVI